ncbi:hypothetical protein C723_3206 [Christiangramia flava JLT2011]|nr:hypothetical protein C723_3206 [Christiangramia flava JLT2011]
MWKSLQFIASSFVYTRNLFQESTKKGYNSLTGKFPVDKW